MGWRTKKKMGKRVLGLFLGLAVLTAGCDVLDPGGSKGTVEVNNTYTASGSACNVWVNFDGNYAVTLAYGQLYTFPLADPGNHTVNFGSYGGCGGSGSCPFSNNNNTTYSQSIAVTAGDLYVLKIAQGSAGCSIYTVTGP